MEGKGKGSLACSKTECQATLVSGAEVGECNEWSRKNFGSNEWNEPTVGTWMREEIYKFKARDYLIHYINFVSLQEPLTSIFLISKSHFVSIQNLVILKL